MSLTDPTVLIYVTTIWHCFWSSECSMKEVRTTQCGGAEYKRKKKVRLIECAKMLMKCV
jgi:hypothetical protein